jgi:lipoprotein-releasing system permease protein
MSSRGFELFIALRYLRAKRKQAVISVITVISVVGVAAGVMALIVALAVNNGFRSTLQRMLLSATAHVSILEKEPGYGIENWRALVPKLRALPHVTAAAPALYGAVFLVGPMQSSGAMLKGIDLKSDTHLADLRKNLKSGSIEALGGNSELPGVLLGSKLAQNTGLLVNSRFTLISPQGELTPLGPRPSYHRYRVAGIFETGFGDLDGAWAFSSLENVQKVLALSDVVNSIELKVDRLDLAPEVARQAERVAGPKLTATHWMEQNKQLLNALKMERAVTVITIGLIQLVAALNILISLMMMVMEKHRDIAILMSMGARAAQIRRLFQLQGVLIGVVGAGIGVALGYLVCYLGDHYRLIRLDQEVYSLSYVPFEPRWLDGVWIGLGAVVVSFLATVYPARAASKVAPAEALRYE